MYATVQLLLRESEEDDASAPGAPHVPVAKWFTFEVGTGGLDDGLVVIKAHASPILQAPPCVRLWSQVRGGGGHLGHADQLRQLRLLLRESGLQGDAAAHTLEVDSPFDYARQGQFVTVETLADPGTRRGFTQEMVLALLRDIARVEHGALVPFTSREQMRLAVEALLAALRTRVQVQGELPRTLLIRQHRERVEAGQASVIFGMQSFGEGLIGARPAVRDGVHRQAALAAPDDPVGEARSEWLRSAGRDPFSELVVPATAIRLAQWTVAPSAPRPTRPLSIADRRLVGTGYGQRLLQSLPTFTMLRDAQGREFPVPARSP